MVAIIEDLVDEVEKAAPVDERIMMLIDCASLVVPTLQDEASCTWMHYTRVPLQAIRDLSGSIG
ncbi:MAG: hypothetical protein M3Q73_04090 [bacterium]|nr:hypothetical protein [bacterium]